MAPFVAGRKYGERPVFWVIAHGGDGAAEFNRFPSILAGGLVWIRQVSLAEGQGIDGQDWLWLGGLR